MNGKFNKFYQKKQTKSPQNHITKIGSEWKNTSNCFFLWMLLLIQKGTYSSPVRARHGCLSWVRSLTEFLHSKVLGRVQQHVILCHDVYRRCRITVRVADRLYGQWKVWLYASGHSFGPFTFSIFSTEPQKGWILVTAPNCVSKTCMLVQL